MSNAQADKRAINCQESIKYFKDHALKHFTEEEAYMASINYKGFETHRHLHDGFRKKSFQNWKKNWEKPIIPQILSAIFLAFVPAG